MSEICWTLVQVYSLGLVEAVCTFAYQGLRACIMAFGRMSDVLPFAMGVHF
jgi:hypothetical protein